MRSPCTCAYCLSAILALFTCFDLWGYISLEEIEKRMKSVPEYAHLLRGMRVLYSPARAYHETFQNVQEEVGYDC